ncbi:MAG: type II toxin-antitoxin system RelE/ParE family toxin [Alphaproteobacteria bacterium]|nr:type II toxin-antitoxin system RelE/ParE family toxin [Alphaproteobacteria bacterium]
MRVVYLDAAEEELLAALDHLLHASSSKAVAEALVAEVGEAEKRIGELPEAHPPAGEDARRYLLKRFPYQLIYRVKGDEIQILAFAHLKRRPGYWRLR